MSDAAMATVFDYFHARRRRDLAAIGSSLDPDVVHQGVLPDLVCEGRAAVLERTGASIGEGDSGIEHLELHAAGERVVARIAGSRFREIPFLAGEIFMVFTLRDGRILRIDDYRTREEAFGAVTMPAPASR